MTKTSSLLKGAKALTSSRASRCTRRVSLQLSKQNRCVPREVDHRRTPQSRLLTTRSLLVKRAQVASVAKIESAPMPEIAYDSDDD